MSRNSWGDPIGPASAEKDWTSSEMGVSTQEQQGGQAGGAGGAGPGGKTDFTEKEAQAIRELKASTTWWKTVGRISGGATAIFLARRRRPPPGLLGSLGFGILGTFIGEGLSLPFAILAGGRRAISSVEDPKHFAKVLQERQAMQNGRGLPGMGPRIGQGQGQSQSQSPGQQQEAQRQGVMGRDLGGDKEFGVSGDFKDSSFPDFASSSPSSSNTTPRYSPSRQQEPSSPLSSSSSHPPSSSSPSSSLPPPSFDVPPNSISDPFSPNPSSGPNSNGASGSGGARRQGGSRWAELRGEAQSGESAWARLRRGEGPAGGGAGAGQQQQTQ